MRNEAGVKGNEIQIAVRLCNDETCEKQTSESVLNYGSCYRVGHGMNEYFNFSNVITLPDIVTRNIVTYSDNDIPVTKNICVCVFVYDTYVVIVM
jgi:hypothetical protein